MNIVLMPNNESVDLDTSIGQYKYLAYELGGHPSEAFSVLEKLYVVAKKCQQEEENILLGFDAWFKNWTSSGQPGEGYDHHKWMAEEVWKASGRENNMHLEVCGDKINELIDRIKFLEKERK